MMKAARIAKTWLDVAFALGSIVCVALLVWLLASPVFVTDPPWFARMVLVTRKLIVLEPRIAGTAQQKRRHEGHERRDELGPAMGLHAISSVPDGPWARCRT